MFVKRTYRYVDGARVEGTWQHIFIRNGDTYFLTDMAIYADGTVDCWGLTDLDGLRRHLETGWVATEIPQGARASASDLVDWNFDEPEFFVSAQGLLGETADKIDELNGRPDSSVRCLMAVDTFLDDPTESNRTAAREAYLAIPEHLRMFALGDMDSKDWPLATLVTAVGQRRAGYDDRVVTAEMHAHTEKYFRDRERLRASLPVAPPDGPVTAASPTVQLPMAHFHEDRLADPGRHILQIDYPAPIEYDGRTYPTVEHAYWAMSTSDPEARERIRTATRTHDARTLAADAPRRDGWPVARLAVMADLNRAKYTQHPDLAETLLGTGDARIMLAGTFSGYWYGHGSNWVGRLLEVVRSELVVARWRDD
ncbi:NADAR family protein [Stackebrandtia soli]|uniref:NADAR family protein n=1 Tax=Stackebrandtia soli TaxID=1892856 RepID=UPI0039EBD881